jgi:NitT/TauT family transport system substrate-binding protein
MAGVALAGPLFPARAAASLRVGHFPNITHSQALIGRGKGWFESALGSHASLQWSSFTAGPTAMEALLAGSLDMTYIGPNPALTGYIRSEGAVRVIAGAVSGGASLVVRNDAGIQKIQDFQGKKIASPQLGNTQDVALRHWLRQNNLKTTDKGGNVQVIPIAPADQMTMFLQKQMDAAWAPEPWATRLILEANCRRYLDERDLWSNHQFTVGELVASTKILQQQPALVRTWMKAHVELTDWINGNAAQAQQVANAELLKETHKNLSDAVLQQAFSRLDVTYDPLRASLLTSAQYEFDEGFLGKTMPDLSGLFDLSILNSILAERKKKVIR